MALRIIILSKHFLLYIYIYIYVNIYNIYIYIYITETMREYSQTRSDKLISSDLAS